MEPTTTEQTREEDEAASVGMEQDDDIDIDDAELDDEEGSGSEGSEGSDEEEEEEDEDEGNADEDEDAAEEAAEAERMLSFVADMPEEERGRLREVVWAQSPGFKHWPAFIYHPADVNDDLRKNLYRGKGNEGPKTHHIVFYYNFGSNAFAGVPFKSVLPWTPENNEALAKACNKYKNKLPGAIEAAEADMGRPKDDRNPGPPDVKAIRKQEREARRLEREQQRKERQAQRRKEKEAARRQRRAERKRRAQEDGGAGAKKKRKKEQGGGGGAAKKAKAVFASESEEERFGRLARNLEILLGVGAKEELNVPKICSTLDKLAAMRATMKQLTDTGVGQLVKDLRKHEDAGIVAKAKHTFATWKGSLAATPAPAPAPAPASAPAPEPAPAVAEAAEPEKAEPEKAVAKAEEREENEKGKKQQQRRKEKEKGERAAPAAPEPKGEPPAAEQGAAEEAAASKPSAEGGARAGTTSTSDGADAGAAPAAEVNPVGAVPEEAGAAGAGKAPASQNGNASPGKGLAAAPAAFGGSDAFADMDEAKKRQRAWSLLKQVLEEGAEAQAPAGGSLSAVAEQAEGLVFAHRKGADEKYLSYVRGLCSAVKGNHHELRDRLLRGEVAPALADFLNKV